MSRLHIPPFVNYDCTLCGWCCHQYDISFSQEDYERLAKREWGALEPDLAGREWCAPLRGERGYAQYRLRYTPEGACVFLGRDNKCLMHKHVGELGKALGCCVYPFTFVDSPTGVYVGLRFSCRAVAYGIGEPILRREEMLSRQLELCEKGGHVPRCGEELSFDGKRTIPWRDYLAIEETLIRVLLRDDLPFARRMLLFAKFIEILRDIRIEAMRGKRFRELLGILETGLFNEAQADPFPPPPGALWRCMFRQFCFQFQRRQGGAYRELSAWGEFRERLRQFWTGVQFVAGRGTPSLPAFPDPLPLGRMDEMRVRDLDEGAEMALSRFMAAKLFGKQYFGKFFFNYSLMDGLNFLLLVGGSVMWFARARALARGAARFEREDVIEAVRYVDFCYGYSRAPDLLTARISVRTLSRGDLAARLALSQFKAPAA